jgi:Holliday junction resolvasome RuvABC ATP-dependent DNA helicase subunit
MTVERTVGGMRYYTLPPLILFIDEVHALPTIVKEGLLKMTEKEDGIFEIGMMRVDCRNITIITATTDPGKLPATLKSRFPIKIALQKHSLEQVAEIILDGRDWTKKQAMTLARMKPVPREAKDIADLIDGTVDTEDCSIDKAIKLVTADLGLEDGCLSQKAIDVLVSLAESQPAGLSKKNICAQLDNMDETEFEAEIIPQLLRNEFHPSLIAISSRHKITDAGLDELRSRKLIDY